jgi:hypothetical protein
MPKSQPEPIGESLEEVPYRLVAPEIAEEYAQLRRDYQALFAQERKAYKQAERFLRKRKAKPSEFEELRAKREAEIRRLEEEFKAKLNALLGTLK